MPENFCEDQPCVGSLPRFVLRARQITFISYFIQSQHCCPGLPLDCHNISFDTLLSTTTMQERCQTPTPPLEHHHFTAMLSPPPPPSAERRMITLRHTMEGNPPFLPDFPSLMISEEERTDSPTSVMNVEQHQKREQSIRPIKIRRKSRPWRCIEERSESFPPPPPLWTLRPLYSESSTIVKPMPRR